MFKKIFNMFKHIRFIPQKDGFRFKITWKV